ncbi:ribose-5-phosphate isomerase RpiA [Halohasta litorea]|uniref:Ribose-5-phosphate isomerase A n=1 Tax=Halohasta litorea TaxID=869891 RepID=A0ABD6D3D2_9EURY|nr:ribose-5-phosphate isomerase RpiA [Halohasta litorea]
MKSTGGSSDAKRRAGEAAAEGVTDGMVVGLGTGSTAAHAIRALGAAVDDGLDIVGVPTSFASRELAIEQGIPLADLDEVDGLDIAIDGADQIVLESGNCIKGGGAAHAREKLVAAAAEEFHVVVDPTKVAEQLDHTVAVEVLPAARTGVEAAVEKLGGEPSLRRAANKDGPVVTDNGNLVVDADFGGVDDPAELAASLSAVPGVVEHGLFVSYASAVYVGSEDGVSETTY